MRSLLLLMAFTAMPTWSSAQEPSTGTLPRGITPIAPPTPEELACSRTGGSQTTISALAEMPVGSCVTVTGWHYEFALMADLESLYRFEAVGDRPRPGQRIGLSGVPATYSDAGVRVTAIIRDCAARRPMAAEAPDYCWFNAGRYLAAVRWQLESQSGFERIPLARRPSALGNLAVMEEGDAAARLSAAAAPLWAAIAANDERQLRELLGLADPLRAAVIMQAAQPAAERWTMDRPQTIVLGWRLHAEASNDQRDTFAGRETVEGVVCAADDVTAMAGLWPIDARDGAVHPERSYVCANIWLTNGDTPQISMRTSAMILPEPAFTRR